MMTKPDSIIITAVGTDGQTVDAPDCEASAFDAYWLPDTLMSIGFSSDCTVFDPAKLAREADIYLRHRVSIEANDPLGRNAMVLHNVACAGAKHGAHEIRLTPRG